MIHGAAGYVVVVVPAAVALALVGLIVQRWWQNRR